MDAGALAVAGDDQPDMFVVLLQTAGDAVAGVGVAAQRAQENRASGMPFVVGDQPGQLAVQLARDTCAEQQEIPIWMGLMQGSDYGGRQGEHGKLRL
jgi:hypothetical protein